MYWSSIAEKLQDAAIHTTHTLTRTYIHVSEQSSYILYFLLLGTYRDILYLISQCTLPLVFTLALAWLELSTSQLIRTKRQKTKPRERYLPFSVVKCSEIMRDHLHIKQWSLFITKMTKMFNELQIFQS